MKILQMQLVKTHHHLMCQHKQECEVYLRTIALLLKHLSNSLFHFQDVTLRFMCCCLAEILKCRFCVQNAVDSFNNVLQLKQCVELVSGTFFWEGGLVLR